MKGAPPLGISQDYTPEPTNNRRDQADQTVDLSHLTHTVQTLLSQSAKRQEQYAQFIKETQQHHLENYDRHLTELKQLRDQFNELIQSQKKLREEKWAKIPQLKPSVQLAPPNSFKKRRFQPKEAGFLQCQLEFIYLTPLVQDALSESFPSVVWICGMTRAPTINHQIKAVVYETDHEQILQALINEYPLQLTTPDQQVVKLNFRIPADFSAIDYYENKPTLIDFIDAKTHQLYGCGYISTRQLLYYQEKDASVTTEKITLYDPIKTRRAIAYAHVRMSTRLVTEEGNQSTYRIQSNDPITLPSVRDDTKEMRMIQRINKHKMVQSALFGPYSKLDEEEKNIKALELHLQSKQLENISSYKQAHKGELLEKIVEEAIAKLHNYRVQLGMPLVIPFEIELGSPPPLNLKVFFEIANIDKTPLAEPIRKLVTVSLVNPQSVSGQFGMGYSTNYDIFDQIIQPHGSQAIGLAVKCFVALAFHRSLPFVPLSLEVVLKEEQTIVARGRAKLQMEAPPFTHNHHMHGYESEFSELLIDSRHRSQAIIASEASFEYQWIGSTQLLVRVKHLAVGKNIGYICVYDSGMQALKQCYCLIIHSYPRISPIRLKLGEVRLFTLPLSVYKMLLKQSESKDSKDKAISLKIEAPRRIVLSTSSKSAKATVSGSAQLSVPGNSQLQLTVRLQSFSGQASKIIVKAAETHSQTVLEQWLLELETEVSSHKNTYKVVVKEGQQLKYSFEVPNKTKKEIQVRLYSSNKSVLNLPEGPIIIQPHMTATVALELSLPKNKSTECIIALTSDGLTWETYLFKVHQAE